MQLSRGGSREHLLQKGQSVGERESRVSVFPSPTPPSEGRGGEREEGREEEERGMEEEGREEEGGGMEG